jgi:cation diffusion facilitator family transporter
LYKYNYYYGQKLNNQGIIANAYENKSDALSSLAIAAGTLIISFLGEKFSILDSLLAVMVSLIILNFSIEIIIKNFQILLGAGSSEEVLKNIEECVLKNRDILDVHKVRTRFEGGYLFVDMHVTIKKDLSIHEGHIIASSVEQEIKAQIKGVKDVVIHLEPEGVGEKKCQE